MSKVPPVEQAILEANALSAALDAVDGKASRELAVELTGRALDGYGGRDLGGSVIRYAMEHITGRPHTQRPKVKPFGKSLDKRTFEATAIAWLRWASQESDGLDALRQSQEDGESYQPQGSALHLMALRPWHLAVRALLLGDRGEAKRLFRRSTELGSQCGTESNPVVQWTYVATFFYTG